jgi:hypothetical protein
MTGAALVVVSGGARFAQGEKYLDSLRRTTTELYEALTK